MSSYPPGSRADHNKFCETEEWELVRNATGQEVRHHRVYELNLNDGSILRTHISRPISREQYGATMWSEILREQLCVSREEFWCCVQKGDLPDRPGNTKVRGFTSEPKPAGLVDKLLRLVGLTAEEIGQMTKAEAVARMNEYWTENS